MTVGNATRMAIISLLLSLVFSSGEGLRLFPIPVKADASVGADSGSISSSAVVRYEFAARRAASPAKQGNAGNLKLGGPGSVGPAFSLAPETSFLGSAARGKFEWAHVNRRHGFQSRHRNRGPPSRQA